MYNCVLKVITLWFGSLALVSDWANIPTADLQGELPVATAVRLSGAGNRKQKSNYPHLKASFPSCDLGNTLSPSEPGSACFK